MAAEEGTRGAWPAAGTPEVAAAARRPAREPAGSTRAAAGHHPLAMIAARAATDARAPGPGPAANSVRAASTGRAASPAPGANTGRAAKPLRTASAVRVVTPVPARDRRASCRPARGPLPAEGRRPGRNRPPVRDRHPDPPPVRSRPRCLRGARRWTGVHRGIDSLPPPLRTLVPDHDPIGAPVDEHRECPYLAALRRQNSRIGPDGLVGWTSGDEIGQICDVMFRSRVLMPLLALAGVLTVAAPRAVSAASEPRTAYVGVAVATAWVAPGMDRPVDAPAVGDRSTSGNGPRT